MSEPTYSVRLGDLIDGIKQTRTDPLDQLADAVMIAEHLGEVADQLIGHFVDQARRAGSSWKEIGASMGVTKQAAQKRFVAKSADLPPIDPAEGFRKFTPRARNTVMAAQSEARAAGNDLISPRHLLLGLLSEPEALAARAIVAQGVTLSAVRERTALPAAASTVPDLIPYDPPAQAVLEATFSEAIAHGHNYIGTEHILLALYSDDDVAAHLDDVGLARGPVEEHVLEAVRAAAGG
ncbi:MAG TPA: Clp protease N-terminal domain-containing protein [Aldersonia sp.]